MNNLPTPNDDHPIVSLAEQRLRDFAGPEQDRTHAAVLLAMWAHADQLTGPEYRAVLRRFPLPPDAPPGSWLHLSDDEGCQPESMDLPDGVDGSPIGGRRAKCAWCRALVPIVGGRFTVHIRPAEGDHCRDSGRPVQTDAD